MKKSTPPQSLSEAISELQNALVENLRPHFDNIKDKVESEAVEGKAKVEESVKNNPWSVLLAVGVVAFIVGLLLGRRKNGEKK